MDSTLKDILVPIDFKAPSMNALEYAINLAKRTNGRIYLLYVIEAGGILEDLFVSVDEIVKVTEKVKEKLQALANQLQDTHHMMVLTRIERGRPSKKILEVAEELKPRFIILGENHQGDDTPQVLGATVEQVTLNSPVPVITTKGNYKDFGSQMVVPLDLTKETRRQLVSSIAYAKNYNTKICLVSALIGGIIFTESRIYRKLKHARHVLTENKIEACMKLFPRTKVPPYKRVLEFADEMNADLILVMTHQEGFTFDNYIGAFAHHIINESKIPVLSLTASASSQSYGEILKDLLDPLGVLAPKTIRQQPLKRLFRKNRK
ncbi:universal stress protein [Gaoshiqia sediminis]|uniref:Universal stress protein n=1 Tax=Gaoshiqia sediminis TaxID=2986998 RepID=A0AA41Y8C9_9BACT|nr:universal stress protein [Gaoshiqia sediminis]MCW0482803.1 universal stress protein [Gaoshiqia sediminis]